MTRPLLVDLFCGEGGAAKGYHDAGFDILGVDKVRMPRYPYPFVQADIMKLTPAFFTEHRAAAIHASPPCQFGTALRHAPRAKDSHRNLIPATRRLLTLTGLPYVIENVEGAPLVDPVMLCPMMFGRELYRHRLFEASFPIEQPGHPQHVKPASKAGHWKPGTVMSIAGHIAPVAMGRELMDIDWTTREELAEAIPPYFTEHVGVQLLDMISEPGENVA